jgi:hypothetical protein
MNTRKSVHRTVVLGASLVAAAAAGPLHAQTPVAARSGAEAAAPTLEAVRSATERFRDVKTALAEGYLRDPHDMCITAEMEGLPRQLGAMGVHYFRPDLLGITAVEPRVSGTGTHTDFTKPAVLIYEPQADGTLELVAVENLVFKAAWRAAGHTAPPSFQGNEYYSMVDNPATEADEAHGFEPHYELHMWLYRENPNGMFAQFNPRVSCAAMPRHDGH